MPEMYSYLRSAEETPEKFRRAMRLDIRRAQRKRGAFRQVGGNAFGPLKLRR